MEEKELGAELTVVVVFDVQMYKTRSKIDRHLELQECEIGLVLTVFSLL